MPHFSVRKNKSRVQEACCKCLRMSKGGLPGTLQALVFGTDPQGPRNRLPQSFRSGEDTPLLRSFRQEKPARINRNAANAPEMLLKTHRRPSPYGNPKKRPASRCPSRVLIKKPSQHVSFRPIFVKSKCSREMFTFWSPRSTWIKTRPSKGEGGHFWTSCWSQTSESAGRWSWSPSCEGELSEKIRGFFVWVAARLLFSPLKSRACVFPRSFSGKAGRAFVPLFFSGKAGAALLLQKIDGNGSMPYGHLPPQNHHVCRLVLYRRILNPPSTGPTSM